MLSRLRTQRLLPFQVVIRECTTMLNPHSTGNLWVLLGSFYKWVNWGVEALRACSKARKFHSVSRLVSEEARGSCWAAPCSLLWEWVHDSLAAFEVALVFRHTHNLHWKLTLSCTELERGRCCSWSDTRFGWGAAINFKGLWFWGALDQVLCEAPVLQRDQKSIRTSQRGVSLNARPNQGHTHPF